VFLTLTSASDYTLLHEEESDKLEEGKEDRSGATARSSVCCHGRTIRDCSQRPKREGFAACDWPDGSKYRGFWKNDKQDGKVPQFSRRRSNLP
jgi:hypothetical protein